jgi:hypothetical protein
MASVVVMMAFVYQHNVRRLLHYEYMRMRDKLLSITINPCTHPMSATSALAYLENMHAVWLEPHRQPSFFE